MSRPWEAVKRWVVPDPALDLEHQFFHGLCLLGGVLAIFVVIPVNQFQNLSPWVDRVVFVFGLVSLALAWSARRGRYHRKTMLVSLIACLDLIWFANGGSQGSIGLYFFSAALFLVLFFQGAFRYVVLAFLVANILGLHLAEQIWPASVHTFANRLERLVDLSAGYVLSMLICALMLWVVLEGFNREKARLKATLAAMKASEDKFSRIFEGNPDALLILDPDSGRVLEANQGFERLFGLARAGILGVPVQDLGFWADRSGHARILELARRDGEIRAMELAFLRKDGTTLWGDASIVPVRFADHDSHLFTIRDATERYRAAEALAESERLYRELLERQGEGFAVVDANERFLYANPVAEQIFGVPAGALQGRLLLDFLEPEMQALVRAETKVREEQRKSTYEVRIRRPSGEFRTLLVTATPGRPRANEPLNIIGVFRDVTEERQAEQTKRLLEHEVHQAQKMDSLGSLAGGVAHDFNNMLGGIMGYADLLLSGETEPRRQEYLRAIILAASRSGELTRKLLAFGRRGRNIVESLDLRAVALECLAMLRPSMSPEIQVVLDFEDGLMVDGDPSQIHQVLLNLCLNGLEAMPERGTLSLGGRLRDLQDQGQTGLPLPAGRYVELTVADQGFGMTEEVRQRVFEPFFTTKNATGMTGTGLGLSTAYGIVRAHRGAITVESARGKGSTFHVFLPLGALPPTERAPQEAAPRGQGTVLLVEDEPLLRELGGSVLESLGYRVLAAEDGELGVAAFRDHHASLCAVLLDLKMPRKGGREAYLEMRAIDASVPVIVCTGYGDNEEVQQLLSEGAAGMLAKPYRIAELSARLGDVTAG